MPRSRRLRSVPQLALDETVIADDDIEAALEARDARRAEAGAARAAYRTAHDLALVAVAKLELPDGAAARVGRFRVERVFSRARSVSFETAAKSRVKISRVEDDE